MSADRRRKPPARPNGLAAALLVAGPSALTVVGSGPARSGAEPLEPVTPLPAGTSGPQLPDAGAHALLPAAAVDEHQDQCTAGLLVHPRVPLIVYDAAAGRPFASIRPAHAGDKTWLSAIDQQPGWVRVLLAARPIGATGWLQANRVSAAHSHHEIRLHLEAARLHLLHDGETVGAWPASYAAELSLTSGRTFLHATVRRNPAEAPLLLSLGTHSRPTEAGLITIHGRSATIGFSGRGGVQVPPQAMAALGDVPLGCLVRIFH
jgi:hypothetical protein